MKFYLHKTHIILVNKATNNFCKKTLFTSYASSLPLVDNEKIMKYKFIVIFQFCFEISFRNEKENSHFINILLKIT